MHVRQMQTVCLILSCVLAGAFASSDRVRTPSGTHDQFWIRLADHTASGAQVGSLSNHPALRNQSLQDGAVRVNRSFSIISKSSDGAQYFRADPATGLVSTARTIDRDELCVESKLCCDNELVCTFTFRALIVAGKSQVMPLVHVSVTDQNDNAPRFAESTIALEVLESNEPRSAYRVHEMRLPPATDLDSKNYSIRDYRLVTTEPSKFSIRKPLSLLDTSEMIVLLIREPLDREEQERYQMSVVAFDGGQPPQSSTMTVVIHVRDANDHQPVFVNKTYSATVAETFPLGEVILQLNATDKDDSENGRVVYEFDQTVPEDIRRRFALDSHTGMLRLDSPLDYEMHRFYRFVVIAHDAVESAKFDKATVTISVTDVNDEYPVIETDMLDATSSTPESVRPGTTVIYAKVIDNEGFSGNCSIENERFGLELILDNNRQAIPKSLEYNIITLQQLDRELNRVERIRIRCVDSFSENGLESTKEVNLTITDVNDNRPIIDKAFLDVSVLENNTPNEQIVLLHADDSDEGENSQLHFQIGGAVQNIFRIDSSTGQVFAMRTLDREERAKYTLPIIVHDLGTPSLTSTETLTITIIDQNDNAPKFAENGYEFTAAEHERSGTYVGQVRASDIDDPKSGGEITYSLSASSGAPFTISQRDGILYTAQELNREDRDHYAFEVVATDNGNPQLSASVMVMVRVSDKNDHQPRIRFPVGVNTTFRVSCTEQLHHIITTINATDDDQDRNAVLTYSIVPGGDTSLFHLDPENGSLQLSRPLTEQECGRQEKLTIEVRDGGSPSLRSETNLIVIFDGALRPSNSGNGAAASKKPNTLKPAFGSQLNDDRNVDATMETILLVVVFAVLIAMLVITFVVIFMSRKHNPLAASLCKHCADPEAGDSDEHSIRARKQNVRHRRQVNRKRHAGEKRQATNRESSSSEDHAAAVAALLSSDPTQAAVFNADRAHFRNYIPHMLSDNELCGSKCDDEDNNNCKSTDSRSCSLKKQKRRNLHKGDTLLATHRNMREPVALDEDANNGDGSPSVVASEKYDSIQVVEVNEVHPSNNLMPVVLAPDGSNYYLPAHHPMNLYSGDDREMMQENEFVGDGTTPIRLIPLDREINQDGMVMCNVQTMNYCACPNCSQMSHLDADSVASRTLIKNMHIHATSPFRDARSVSNVASCRDCSTSSIRSKPTATPCRMFPQIENSMI